LAQQVAPAARGRIVNVVPLMIPSATVVDHRVLARAALARSPDVVVAFVVLAGFQADPAIASQLIADLFHAAPATPGALAGAHAAALPRHSTLYRAGPLLRAMAMQSATAVWSTGETRERGAIRTAFTRIGEASRHGDLPALLAAYRTIAYLPPARAQFR